MEASIVKASAEEEMEVNAVSVDLVSDPSATRKFAITYQGVHTFDETDRKTPIVSNLKYVRIDVGMQGLTEQEMMACPPVQLKAELTFEEPGKVYGAPVPAPPGGGSNLMGGVEWLQNGRASFSKLKVMTASSFHQHRLFRIRVNVENDPELVAVTEPFRVVTKLRVAKRPRTLPTDGQLVSYVPGMEQPMSDQAESPPFPPQGPTVMGNATAAAPQAMPPPHAATWPPARAAPPIVPGTAHSVDEAAELFYRALKRHGTQHTYDPALLNLLEKRQSERRVFVRDEAAATPVPEPAASAPVALPSQPSQPAPLASLPPDSALPAATYAPQAALIGVCATTAAEAPKMMQTTTADTEIYNPNGVQEIEREEIEMTREIVARRNPSGATTYEGEEGEEEEEEEGDDVEDEGESMADDQMDTGDADLAAASLAMFATAAAAAPPAPAVKKAGPGGRHEHMKAWNWEEDTIVQDLVKQHGFKWKTISKRLPGRSVSMVRNRYWRVLKGQKAREQGDAKNTCHVCGEKKLGHVCTGAAQINVANMLAGGMKADGASDYELEAPPLHTSSDGFGY